MHETQGDRLLARAAPHPTGPYLSLREIEMAELQDVLMQGTIGFAWLVDMGGASKSREKYVARIMELQRL